MLSYQHEYHAGNHADVLKHICLCRILRFLCQKEKPFTIIDSHGGAGRYSLSDERLLKTGEAEGGIKKLSAYRVYAKDTDIPPAVSDYLAVESPYLAQDLYAGSAEIERLFLRAQDHQFVSEKHPQAYSSLQTAAALPLLTEAGEKEALGKTLISQKDGYSELNALTPPLVKRGLVLCDPSYEDAEDYTKVRNALQTVRRKWNTAIIALWYPLLVRRKNETAQMLSALEDFSKLGNSPCTSFRAELCIWKPEDMVQKDGSHLYGSGMLVINPPWKLREEMEEACDFLSSCLKP